MTTTETPTYLFHLNGRNMSGRVVKFRVLEIDEIDAISRNAANAAGEGADMARLIQEQRRMLASYFIVAVSPPGQEPKRRIITPAVAEVKDEAGNVTKPAKEANTAVEPWQPDVEKLQGVVWKSSDAGTLQRDWAKVFSTKETAALIALYRDWHELNGVEYEMILGKGIPTPTGV